MKQFLARLWFTSIIVVVLTLEVTWVLFFGLVFDPHPPVSSCILPGLLLVGTIGHFLKK